MRRNAGRVDLVILGGSCTLTVMGVDREALARRCRKAGRCLVLRRGLDDQEKEPAAVADLFRLFLQGRRTAARPDPDTVNLFDFPARCREEEMIPFLAELGLKTGVCLLPEVDVRTVRRLPRAAWQVFREQSSTGSALRRFSQEQSLSPVPVDAPYGIRGTRLCLSAIAKAAGREKAFSAAWRRSTRPTSSRPCWRTPAGSSAPRARRPSTRCRRSPPMPAPSWTPSRRRRSTAPRSPPFN